MGKSYDLPDWAEVRQRLYELAEALPDNELEQVDGAVSVLDALLGKGLGLSA